jgi:hypothetical protein
VPRESAGKLEIDIEGFELPGLSCAPAGAGEQYTNVHVGIQRLREVIDLHPGDAATVGWSFEVVTRRAGDDIDFGGPFVHGRRGDRFLYLSWGVVEGSAFRMFRRAKLHFADADPDVLASAVETERLRCRVRMTDRRGDPRCARVRPPDAVWTSGTS